jgi:hypothetical protein
MAGPWKSGLLLLTSFNPADERNIGMKQIILPVAVVGLAIGGNLASLKSTQVHRRPPNRCISLRLPWTPPKQPRKR